MSRSPAMSSLRIWKLLINKKATFIYLLFSLGRQQQRASANTDALITLTNFCLLSFVSSANSAYISVSSTAVAKMASVFWSLLMVFSSIYHKAVRVNTNYLDKKFNIAATMNDCILVSYDYKQQCKSNHGMQCCRRKKLKIYYSNSLNHHFNIKDGESCP